MRFQNFNGTGRISIRLNEIGSYLHFDKPLCAVWYDCRGSVGKYFTLLPLPEESRKTLRDKINLAVYENFTGREQELRDLLSPLLSLLPKGEFSINYYHSDDPSYFQYTTTRDNRTETHEFDWFTVFTEVSHLSRENEKREEFEKWKRTVSNKHFTPDILEYTDGFYDGHARSFIASEAKSNIDEERVKYFEERLKQGDRPFVILFSASVNDDDLPEEMGYFSAESDNYILDGHHKLQAYEKLKLRPSVVEIRQLADSADEVAFDMEELIDELFPWQIQHMLKHWSNKQYHLKHLLDNPQSKIHRFIKNGEVKEYHPNGKTKHEAFYINAVIEGKAQWWHENGKLKEVQYWKNAHREGTWEMWYDTGVLQFVQPFNENGQYHGHMVSYFENGKIRWEQWFENGKNRDGCSYLTYHANGKKEAELKYENGMMIERKNYDASGHLVNFEELDRASGRLVKRK